MILKFIRREKEKRKYNHMFPNTVKFLKGKKAGECCGYHDECQVYEVHKVGKKMICKKCNVEVVLVSDVKLLEKDKNEQ